MNTIGPYMGFNRCPAAAASIPSHFRVGFQSLRMVRSAALRSLLPVPVWIPYTTNLQTHQVTSNPILTHNNYMIRAKTMNQQRISNNNNSMKSLSKRQDDDASHHGPCTTDSVERQPKGPQHQSLEETSSTAIASCGVVNGRALLASSESRKRHLMRPSIHSELSRGQSVLRDNADESNSTAADAFSNSLVDSALTASPLQRTSQTSSGSGGESSSSSGRDNMLLAVTRPATHHASASNSNKRGSSDDAGTGESGHIVTANGASTQTGATTSSGDDRDSSREHSAEGTISVGVDDDAMLSSETTNSVPRPHQAAAAAVPLDPTRGRHRHRTQHHHPRHIFPRSSGYAAAAAATHSSELLARRANDGSTLQVPGDDGSDRLSTGPATVVASRMPLPTGADTSTSSSGSGGEGDAHDNGGLLEPHCEPGYHAIRKTFSRLPKRAATRTTTGAGTYSSSSSEEQKIKLYIAGKHGLPMSPASSTGSGSATLLEPTTKKAKRLSKQSKQAAMKDRMRGPPSPDSDDSNDPEGNGSSSGSGTEEGYMGSADSKENESSSSPSVSSSEGIGRKKSKKRHNAQMFTSPLDADEQGNESGDSSSEIADFSSSGTTSENGEDGDFSLDRFQARSPSISSEDGYEATYFQAKRQLEGQQPHRSMLHSTVRRRCNAIIDESSSRRVIHPSPWTKPSSLLATIVAPMELDQQPQPHIMTIGSDIMAHVLTFLQPPEIMDVLTMPLSRDWRQTFTFQPELWRVLCLLEPFKAEIHDDDDNNNEDQGMDDSRSTDSFCSLGGKASHLQDKYRILYTSFVRCMKYLSQIREDAVNGRNPSFIDYGVTGTKNQEQLVGKNRNLLNFLARARVVTKESEDDSSSAESSSSEEPQQVVAGAATMPTEDGSKKRKRSQSKATKENKLKIGKSSIADRVLGPSASGEPGELELPWSCAIYSIVNWMVSFSDVEGIQTLCLKVLPYLLENELQRQTAQRAGLTDIVLRAMVMFPDSAQLHIAAFHTIVLLARPLGGREGMLFRSSMVLTGIFGGEHAAHPKSGIAVMVESMKRFEDNDVLQAMSCWALVNIALAPSQKAELVKLGGIKATCNAMFRHPFSAEVQFRALFALINLVIPFVRLNRDNNENDTGMEQIRQVTDSSEKEIIDESVGEIAGLVVGAMENFCSSEAILNRACLVLHNLSLTQEYHSTMLWTPNCYRMLEWCLPNYRTDQILQQSATGTLHRLQMTLSSDDDLRAKFTEKLQSQQQATLYQAHREAIRLHERQEELNEAQVEHVAS